MHYHTELSWLCSLEAVLWSGNILLYNIIQRLYCIASIHEFSLINLCVFLVRSHAQEETLIRPQWHPVPYIVHYFWPGSIGLWSKLVHYVGNRVPFGTHSWFKLKSWTWSTGPTSMSMLNAPVEWRQRFVIVYWLIESHSPSVWDLLRNIVLARGWSEGLYSMFSSEKTKTITLSVTEYNTLFPSL
jgi:hypothetical protein